ncbi:GGDEF domain-containing protein [Thaumasiovibrio subtropicus]|uniref:GGDEF domain-containing protein n=1 Tax=Thaumasiovibrio subtropicus TaxID=1891207 RepID=UPI000B35F715|nr:diguanylate cyclase [Thaumasiovibrio subtropicus]
MIPKTDAKSPWLSIVMMGIAYFILARFGMHLFSLQPENLTMIWLPGGVGLVMLLRHGLKAAPVIFLASFLANFNGLHIGHDISHSVFHTFVAAFGDLLAPVWGMKMLQKSLPNGIQYSNDLFKLGLYGCLFPTLLSSSIISANLFFGGYIHFNEVLETQRMLVLADSLGILLIYQCYANWHKRSDDITPQLTDLAILVVLISSILVFSMSEGNDWIAFLVLPCLVMAAFRLDGWLASLISAGTMLCFILLTANGHGALVSSSSVETNSEMMAFVFSCAIAVYGITLQKAHLIETEKAKVHWQYEAQFDSLTRLQNRRAFFSILHDEHLRAEKNHHHVYVLAAFDIDNFKQLNDTYGHAKGDIVLKTLARTMRDACRAKDTAARLGGEEFIVLMPYSSIDDAMLTTDLIRETFSHRAEEECDVTSSVSIGIAQYRPGLEAEEILNAADKALYSAKSSGKNRVVIAPESFASRV